MDSQPLRDHWLGFDLGGTKMLAVVFDSGLQKIGSERKKTKGFEGMEAGLARMVDTVRDALKQADVPAERLAGIGVGCPGPVDAENGVILDTPNLGWKKVPVRRVLEETFGCPVFLANDVDAGLYGEYRMGGAREARCAVGVFPGTGIGGACVYEGKILRGKSISAMEIGHMPILPSGPLTSWGQRGTLESLASRMAIASAAASAAYRGEAPHLLEIAGTDLAKVRSKALAASIQAGDVMVEKIVRDAAHRIGYALCTVVHLLAPDLILLGGGLVEAMPDLFREEVETSLLANVFPVFRDTFRVTISQLGDDATVTGAAAWARQNVTGA